MRTARYLTAVKPRAVLLRQIPLRPPLSRPFSIRHPVKSDHETTNALASTDLLEVYRGMVATGKLRWDDEQIRCVMKVSQPRSS
jgi:hypothetical protein